MKRYYKIYITETKNSVEEIIKGYHHGKSPRATKKYKKLYDDTFYRDMYHSVGTSEISRVDYLKGTKPEFKSLHPKQLEFLKKLRKYSYNKTILLTYNEELVLNDLQGSLMYSVHDSEILNGMLKLFDK
jgi:hypothetical protein